MLADWIPWCICLAAIIGVAMVGLISGRGQKQSDDSFLTGGGKFKAPVVALSLFATSSSGFMFVGAVGAGYTQGLSAIWLPIAWLLGELVFWRFFPERINALAKERQSVSIPDYIAATTPAGERRVRIVAGAIVLFAMAPFMISQSIAAGKAMAASSSIDPQMSVMIAGGTLSAVALLYCLRGGLKSSMSANTAQASLILSIVFFIAILLLVDLGGPAGVVANLDGPEKSKLALFPPDLSWLFLAFMAGGAAASFGAMLGLPSALMRIAVTKDKKELLRARNWYLFIVYGFWCFMTVMGLLLAAALSGDVDPEQALFIWAGNKSPFVLGLILAGLAALILSTLDGAMMVGGSAISDDIGNAEVASPGRKKALRLFGLATFSICPILLAVPLSGSSVFEIMLFGQSALAGGIGPAFMISTLNITTTPFALIATMMTGVLVAIIWAALGLADIAAEALPAFAASLLVHWIITRLARLQPV